jgi:hypothetical protein
MTNNNTGVLTDDGVYLYLCGDVRRSPRKSQVEGKYEMTAEDSISEVWRVYWDIINPEATDLQNICDWSNPSGCRRVQKARIH